MGSKKIKIQFGINWWGNNYYAVINILIYSHLLLTFNYSLVVVLVRVIPINWLDSVFKDISIMKFHTLHYSLSNALTFTVWTPVKVTVLIRGKTATNSRWSRIDKIVVFRHELWLHRASVSCHFSETRISICLTFIFRDSLWKTVNNRRTTVDSA